MKRIEAIIRSDKLNNVVEVLRKENVGGLSVYKTRGRGAGERPLVRGSRGTTQYTADFNSCETVMTVVDDSQVDSIVAAITIAARTGEKGDGKIFVTNVEKTYDISLVREGTMT